MKFIYPEGATPLHEDEVRNLKPKHITSQLELNEWEQMNIIKAEQWLFNRSHNQQVICSIPFIQKLHKEMFGETWQWAGKFRKFQTNIGCESIYIPIELQILCDDVKYQIQHNSEQLIKVMLELLRNLQIVNLRNHT